MRINFRQGQIGLMLLIIMGLVVSLVLSLASRSISDNTLSRQEKENSSAFALAESGVEKALLKLSNIGANTFTAENLSAVDLTVSGKFKIDELKSYDMYVKEGETAQIDLSGSETSVNISWAKTNEVPAGVCTEGSGRAPAAIEAIIINNSNQVTRTYYNAYGCDLSGANNFTNATTPGSNGFTTQQTIAIAPADRWLRIKPLYNNSTIQVTGTGLASQLYLIKSQASGSDVKSDIEAKRSLAAPAAIFDYAIFSNTTIIKN